MIAALDFKGEQGVEQLFEMRPALGLFAGRQDDGLDRHIGGAQAGFQPGQLGGGDMSVGDDDEAALARIRGEPVPGAVERALFDHDVVAARVQRDPD